ncbi:hypothetical protein M7I_2766 [Glarea lozoyensis 74030]|uniref:Uncharacterized protein n=1 Tax=Glarea lozoyensis (strain ATCC 74030 / MF5533) TaxID=1104152 RepID=H0EJN7_GLAL7|nr:hypothetical protein M7I_2766 [Glarea lozoyensis 74030]
MPRDLSADLNNTCLSTQKKDIAKESRVSVRGVCSVWLGAGKGEAHGLDRQIAVGVGKQALSLENAIAR